MRYRAVLHLVTVTVVFLVAWKIFVNSFDDLAAARSIFEVQHFNPEIREAATKSAPKCSLSRDCPPDHFALHIRSGAADIVGPKICFEGKIVMSHLINNVGPGLNMVVVNGENGVVEKHGYFNMSDENPEDILAYLKEIKPGMIILVASFDDVASKLTDEMKEIFVGMGSTLITSVKPRDNWVFAGRAGTKNKSPFEKHAVNDEETNVFEGWPHMVEVGGCFPRTLNI
ncbi:protein FAM3C [Cololabis saira]|uniref:protein FAM3C n=1 Tax=Cololabis saira TaxID=129043 RepID=UPI002AD4FBFE|nr:protein FAM3C [Cololabis saira]